MNKIKVLILGNTPYISNITNILKKNHFIVDVSENNNQFFDYCYNNLYDLYLIYIDEETFSRFELIKLLDDYKNITIKITITQKYAKMVKTSFLYGCDESIINTIDEEEFLLRIKSLIRRQFQVYDNFITLKKNIEYDIFNKQVLVNKKKINIGKTSNLILDYLLKFRGNYISSKNLENGIYPANSPCKNNVIRFHVHKIRKFLGTELIISNKSNGYKINIDI